MDCSAIDDDDNEDEEEAYASMYMVGIIHMIKIIIVKIKFCNA